jgi:hypothetical protein
VRLWWKYVLVYSIIEASVVFHPLALIVGVLIFPLEG